MKHHPVVVSVLLLVLSVMLVACGTDDGIRRRYHIEKELFTLEHQFTGLGIRPDLVSKEQYAELSAGYARVLADCYDALKTIDSARNKKAVVEISTLAFQAATRQTQFLFSRRQFDSCTAVLNTLMNRVGLARDNAMSCFSNLGRALQAGGHWDSAMVVYDRALELFRPPVMSNRELFFKLFNVPLHIYEVLQQAGASERGQQRFQKAEAYYREMTRQYPGTKVSVAAWSNLGRLYEDAGEWRQAIDALNHVADSGGQLPSQVVIKIADMYAGGLHDYATALRMYDSLSTNLTGSDTLLTPVLLYKRSLALMGLKRYHDARQALVRLEAKYPAYYRANPSAQYTKAQTFEKEKNWERAESEYSYLVKRYEGSPQALAAYLHVIRTFRKQGDTTRVNLWRERARKDLERLAARSSGSPEEGQYRLYQASLLSEEGQWDSAAALLGRIHQKYPRTEPGYRALLQAAAIYRDRLGDTATADSLTTLFKQELTEVDAGSGF